jgi:putative DNA primase/helicase
MITPAYLDDLKAAILLADVVGRGVQLTRLGQTHLGRCPFHLERTPSFHVYIDHYHCFGCGAHGDLFTFVMETEGVGFPEAVEMVAAMAGAPTELENTTPLGVPSDGRKPTDDEVRKQLAKLRLALETWDESIDLAATLGLAHLTRPRAQGGRGLDVPERVSGRVLRFHPRCPWRNEAGELVRVPAPIGLYRDIHTDEPRAIWRRPLTADGRKDGDAKAFGPKSGCAIKVTAHEEVAESLHIGEGPETVLAGAMLGFVPAWALGDSNNLKKFPVLSGIEALSIFVDHDANGIGRQAAAECSARWTAAGRDVWRIVPDLMGDDMNDVVGGGA